MKFERKRITDIRQILLDLTLIQIKENVKSMEILTTMYNDVVAIDVDRDLEVSIVCIKSDKYKNGKISFYLFPGV